MSLPQLLNLSWQRVPIQVGMWLTRGIDLPTRQIGDVQLTDGAGQPMMPPQLIARSAEANHLLVRFIDDLPAFDPEEMKDHNRRALWNLAHAGWALHHWTRGDERLQLPPTAALTPDMAPSSVFQLVGLLTLDEWALLAQNTPPSPVRQALEDIGALVRQYLSPRLDAPQALYRALAAQTEAGSSRVNAAGGYHALGPVHPDHQFLMARPEAHHYGLKFHKAPDASDTPDVPIIYATEPEDLDPEDLGCESHKIRPEDVPQTWMINTHHRATTTTKITKLLSRAYNQSGPMQIHRLAMAYGRTHKGRAFRDRAQDAGPRLRSIHRILSDGRVFQQRRRAPGGTILVDTSGSMSLSHEQIMPLLQARPATTIAIYSGNSREGTLSIVAESGRVLMDPRALQKAISDAGSGNVVDVPALAWLNTQPGPRSWVCDGGVTGLRDQATPTITQACRYLAKQGKVTQYLRLAALPVAAS